LDVIGFVEMASNSFRCIFITLIITVSAQNFPCPFEKTCDCALVKPGSVNAYCAASGSNFPKFSKSDLVISELTIVGNFTTVPANAFQKLDSELFILTFNRQDGFEEELTVDENAFAANKSIHTISFNNFKYPMQPTIFRSLSKAPGLEGLTFYSCNVESIPDDTFGNFKSLHKIQIFNSQLKEIGKLAFNGLQQSLVGVDFNRNELREIAPETFRNFMNLIEVRFQTNKISSISNDSFSRELHLLDLTDNPVSEIAEYALPDDTKIVAVLLNTCNLTEIPTQIFHESFRDNVQTIEMENNHIETVRNGTFSKSFPKLTTMPSLSDNPISVIEPGAFEGLVAVNRSYFRNLYELKEIDLSVFAGMENLKNITFDRCRKLRNITVSEIDDVPDSVKRILIIDSDRLDYLDPNIGSILARSRDNILDISNNVVKCDENSIWMKYYLLCTFHPQIKMDGTTCAETEVPLQSYLMKHGNEC
jgi:Leucine-rich repeat (LRR) protein